MKFIRSMQRSYYRIDTFTSFDISPGEYADKENFTVIGYRIKHPSIEEIINGVNTPYEEEVHIYFTYDYDEAVDFLNDMVKEIY